MKLGIKASIFVAVLFIVTGCTYDFSEDYFKELNPVNPNLNIVLTGFINGQETNSSRTVEYVISGAENEDFEMTVKVDDYEIHHSNEQRGEFYLELCGFIQLF